MFHRRPPCHVATRVAPRAVAAPERLEARVLLAAVPTAGHRDPTYGHVGTAAFEGFGRSGDAALQPDGRLLVLGSPADRSGGEIALARFNPDGSPDLSFGGDGKVQLDVRDAAGDAAFAASVAVRPDGRIVLAGGFVRRGMFADTVTNSFVGRLLPDGRLDASFATGGVFAADLDGGGREDSIGSVELDDAGRIIGTFAAGARVVRLTADGSLDPTFAGDGTAVVAAGAGVLTGLLVQADGKLLLTGPFTPSSRRFTDFFFARLNPDGTPDTTFGDAGTGTAFGGLGSFNDSTASYDIAPAPGGGFYAAGTRDGAVVVGRFLPNGAPDPAFDGDGYAFVNSEGIVGGFTSVGGLLSLPDGRPIVAGSTYLNEPNPQPNQVPYYEGRFLAGFNTDGTRDATFGDNGIVDAREDGTTWDHHYTDLVRQADGKLIAVSGVFEATRFESALLPPTNPTPALNGPYRANELYGTGLSAAGSYDLDGNVMKYEWDTDYDGVTFTPDLTGPATSPFFRLDGPSVRNVALRLTDDDGRTAIGTTTLTTDNTPPGVYFAAPRRAKEGSPYVLHLFAPDPGVDTIDHWTIDWGDGTAPQTVPGNVTVIAHTYPDGPATFAVRVSATDEDGTWPAADLGPDLGFGTNGTASSAFVFSVSAVLPLDGGEVLYAGDASGNGRNFSVFRTGADGLPDPTFGGAPGSGFVGESERLARTGFVRSIARQVDGKVLAGGNTYSPVPGGSGTEQWMAVARYLPDGRLDPTFGTAGVLEISIDAALHTAASLVVLPDGKILVGGNQGVGFAVMRLLPDGSLDPAFGAGGKAVGPAVPGPLQRIAVAPDGKIVALTGSAMFGEQFSFSRLNPDGSVDAAFGQGGVVKVPAPGNPSASFIAPRMVLAPDGRIVAAGQAPVPDEPGGPLNYRTVVFRLDANGSPDTTFGRGGFTIVRPFPYGESIGDLALDAQGRPLLVTSSLTEGYALTRLTAAGAPDETFAGDGTMNFDPAAGSDTALAMALDAAGNVVIGGYSVFNFTQRGTVVRLSPHGSHEVLNVEPTVTVTGPPLAFSDQPYAISLGYADPGADSPRSWRIDWGDGTSSDLPGGATSASHAYPGAGTYAVTARVTDEDGTYAKAHSAVVVPAPAVAADGTLVVTGHLSGGATVMLAVAGDAVVVGIGPRQWSFPLASVARVAVTTGTGTDTLEVAASFSAAGLPLSFDGGSGNDKVIARGTAGGDGFEVASSAVHVGSRVLATLVGVERADVFGEAGADRLTIPATSGLINVRFEGGEGDDALESFGNAGQSSFIGGGGADAYTYRASGGGARSFDIRADAVGPSTLTGVENVALYGAGGADRFNVSGTAAGTTYALFGEGGNDVFEISFLNGGFVDMDVLAGNVAFDGGAGTADEVRLTDGTSQASPVANVIYDLSDAAVARVGGPRLNLAGTETVRLQTWRNNDTFRVTPSPTTAFFVSADAFSQANVPGDRLEIIPAGAIGLRQVKTGPADGRIDFTNRRPVTYARVDSQNDVVPPRASTYAYSASAGTYAVTFDEAVTGPFAPGDLSVRNAFTNHVTPATAVTYDATTRTATYTIGSLPMGYYAVTYAPVGVADAAGNAVVATPPQLAVAGVAGRYVFYNGSALDGGDPAATAADDVAVAADKVALRPGQTASPANVTNYSRGLNGIMIDVFGLPSATGHLYFERSAAPGGPWEVVYPVEMIRRAGAGAGGSDRVSAVFQERLVVDCWLRVTLPAAAGLAAADVFYFGNLVGDTGNDRGDPAVNALDVARTRSNVGKTSAAALAAYDFDRDGRISATDVAIVRNNQRSSLPRISERASAPAAAAATPARKARPPRRGVLADPPADLLA